MNTTIVHEDMIGGSGSRPPGLMRDAFGDGSGESSGEGTALWGGVGGPETNTEYRTSVHGGAGLYDGTGFGCGLANGMTDAEHMAIPDYVR